MLRFVIIAICLGLAVAVPAQVSQQSNPLKDYLCQLCQSQLGLFLGEPQKLLTAVNQYCDQLTDETQKTQCMLISNALLTPLAAEMLKLDQSTACQKMLMCPSESLMMYASPPTSITPECDMCKVGVGYLNALITETISHAAWKHLVSTNLCPLFKVPTLITSCNAVMTDTFDSFVQSVAKGYTVDILCVAYNVCPVSESEVNAKLPKSVEL